MALANTFEEGLKPLLVFLTCSGVTPFIYDFSNKPKVFVSFPLLIYSIALYAGYLTCLARVIIRNETIVDIFNGSQILKFSDRFKLFLGFTHVCIFIGEGYFSLNRYAVGIAEYAKIYKAMINLGIKTNYQKLFNNMCAIVVGALSLNCMMGILIFWSVSTWSRKPSWEMIIAVYFPGFIIELVILLYGLSAVTINNDIKLLNEQLAKLCDKELLRGLTGSFANREISAINSALNDLNKELKSRALTKHIHLIWVVFDCICDVSEGIYDAFSFKLLNVVTTSFVLLLFHSFYALSVATSIYVGDSSEDTLSLFFFSLQQSAMTVLLIGILTTLGERCRLSVCCTAVLINKLLLQETSEDVLEELHRFSTSMLHSRPTFSVMGMFSIDNTLLYMIIGTTTTYLIILIQFSVALWENPEMLNVFNTTTNT